MTPRIVGLANEAASSLFEDMDFSAKYNYGGLLDALVYYAKPP